MTAQTKTLVTVYGEKVQINPNSLNTADNGLTASNGNIQLGGALTKPSVLTTTDTWTLAILGLQSGTSTDKILTTDSNGILRTINPGSMPMWSLLGNTGTNPATNFLGTTDNQDLSFRTNNTEKIRLTTEGDLIPNGTSLRNLGLPTNTWKGAYVDYLKVYTGTSSPSITANPNPNTMIDLNNPNGGSAVIRLASSGNGGKLVHMGINPTVNVNGEFVIQTPTVINAFDIDLLTGNVSMGNIPDPSAILRLNSGGNKGLWLPQVPLSATTTWGLLGTTTQEAMFIYNTNASITGPGANGKGLYYWNGVQWTSLNDSGSNANLNWLQGGNTLTADKTFGTISNNNLPFVTNNTERMRIASSGNVGIGNTAPSNTLHVTSAANPVRFEGLQATATPATDNIVVADATGVLKTLNPATLNNGWALKGNADTTTANFIGTTDSAPLYFRINNTNAGSLSTGNTALGYTAFNTTAAGGDNTAIGASALTAGGSNWDNTAIGYMALTNAKTNANTAIGSKALMSFTGSGAGWNTGVGYLALTLTTTGAYNNALGASALNKTTTGSYNSGIGFNAGFNNSTGSYNLFLGDSSGNTNTTGSNNIFIGASADATSATLTNAIAIGYNAKVGQSNSIILGGTGANTVKVGIGNTAPTTTFHVTPVTGTDPVRFEGLQTSVTPATDNIVVADATGVLKTVSSALIAIEPWQVQGTTNKATANTDNIYQTGKVGIGTNNMLGSVDPNVKLAVNGSIITPTSYYADYVFEDYLSGKSDIKSEYKFKSLDQVEKFITENKHLPGVTSIKDLQRNEKGEYIFNITDLSIQSLEKIEELYLHTIQQKKQLEANEKNIDEQKKQLEANEKTIKAMSDRIDSLEKLIRENIKQ
ncbi:hypothetical protein DCO46_15370 [Flavobacterium sp. HTF]|nr:hypothetical protein DCO46_15370 [Flavobacterium sp. HTF]